VWHGRVVRRGRVVWRGHSCPREMWRIAYHVFAGQSAQYDVAAGVPPVVIGCIPALGLSPEGV